MKVCRGFTLLELMVTIAVVAILAAVGIPGFQNLIQNNRITAQTNELVTVLSFARTEAVKRGRNVQVNVAAGATGWTATVTAGGELLRTVDRQGSAVNISAGSIVFSPTGAPVDPEDFLVEPKNNCSGQQRRRVEVGFSGQITTTRMMCGG